MSTSTPQNTAAESTDSPVSRFSEELEVALSGGGLRASAFGLGVLLYLADSGLNRQVVSIASVSGGSLTNGYVAKECDFKELEGVDQFLPVARQLATKISGRGLLSRSNLFAVGYLALLGCGLSAVAITSWVWWPLSLQQAVVLLLVAASILLAALLRGVVVSAWISRTFFTPDTVSKSVPTLGSVADRTVDHVFCTTDLNASEPFFFSTKFGGRIVSMTWGRTSAAGVPLHTVVRASAAFPPLIPPKRFSLDSRSFLGSRRPPYRAVYLSDGGVWNNHGSDWSQLRSDIIKLEIDTTSPTTESLGERERFLERIEVARRHPIGGVRLQVDASSTGRPKRLAWLAVPGLSIVGVLARVLTVSYNSTVSARSADLAAARLRMLNNPQRWEVGGGAQPGILWGDGPGTDQPLEVGVSLRDLPGEIAAAWTARGMLNQWEPENTGRCPSVGQLEPRLQELLDYKRVPTTLNSLGPDRTVGLVVHGYLLARELFTAAFGNHQPPPMPPAAWFERLVNSDVQVTSWPGGR